MDLIAKLPGLATASVAWTPSFDSIYGSRPDVNSTWSEREELVSALYTALCERHLVQVRGTPGSGKTVLLHLLHQRIRQDYPEAFIRRFFSWPRSTENLGISDRLRNLDPEYPRNQISFLLLDDGQDTYWDDLLWNGFLKDVYAQGTKYRVVAFCSYGSSASEAFEPPRGTPPVLHQAARFSLWQDSGSMGGLLLRPNEFKEVVTRFDPLCRKLDQGLQDHIYAWSGGHVGATTELLCFILEKKFMLRNHPGPFTDLDFRREFPLNDVLQRLCYEGLVARGLPHDDNYQPMVTKLFRKILTAGSVERGDYEAATIAYCHRRGWLYAENDTRRPRYLFASPLHAACISFKIDPTDELPKFDSPFELSVATIGKFKPSQLHIPIRRAGPITTVQRPPEAQYQDEFYRAAFLVTRGNVRITPEFASWPGAKVAGRIDFFIPSIKWGIEITRDGSELLQHDRRFRSGGAYHAWIKDGHMAAYILLDFRQSVPVKPHPNLEHLYHVVFDERYENVKIYNNHLKVVRETFQLLENP
ncbi:hypothetical protein AX17_002036 [Amanita inopinata Kibby_2008]|nr:hypothetical protein AX17_002036 [Amanita inopinata Kibby_2008]